MTSIILPPSTDPAGLPPVGKVRRIFSTDPYRNRGAPVLPRDQISDGMLNRLIAYAVELGMPRADAEQARYHAGVRFQLAALFDVGLRAAEGERGAREVIDRVRTGLLSRAREEVTEALRAYEQPANSAETTRLMGLE